MLSYDPPVSINGQDVPSPRPVSSTPQVPVVPGFKSAGASAAVASIANGHTPKYHHIWLVTGPAGCGKTTVAEYLATCLNMPYIEGDAFHTPANVEKMRTGIPLTDADRWDWLTALREESMHQINGGADGVVLTCSALKRKYRDVIRVANYYNHNLLLHFIYLSASEEVLLQRVAARQGHYMGANMVHSQFEALEPPGAEERDVIDIDVSQSLEEVKREALNRVLDTIKDSEDEDR